MHCLATPLLLMSGGIGVLGMMMASKWVHQLMILPVVIITLFSFPTAYKKHRHTMPSLLAVIAVTGLIIAMTYLNNHDFRVISGYNFRPFYGGNYGYNLDSHSILTLISSSILILAHIWNWRLSQTYQRINA